MLKYLFLFIFTTLLVAVFSTIFLPFSIAYHILIPTKWKDGWRLAGVWFYQLSLSLDQFANVSMQSVFNLIMIKKKNRTTETNDQRKKLRKHKDDEGHVKWVWQYFKCYDYHQFGDEDDTLSYVFAMNKERGSLNKFGLFWAWLLDTIDTDHLKKAIEGKNKRDIEAIYRLQAHGYVIDFDPDQFKIGDKRVA